MKKIIITITSLLFVLALASCGQEYTNNQNTLFDDTEYISFSEYSNELIFNFGGKFYLSDTYEEPPHGDYVPKGWYALGGEGECIDPSGTERATFSNGELTAYDWLDNHSDRMIIKSFSVGGYSCCLYQYSFDLFTAPDMELYPNAEPTSEYWVVFYTEGEDKQLYIKYYNCEYFTQEQAIKNINLEIPMLYSSLS